MLYNALSSADYNVIVVDYREYVSVRFDTRGTVQFNDGHRSTPPDNTALPTDALLPFVFRASIGVVGHADVHRRTRAACRVSGDDFARTRRPHRAVRVDATIDGESKFTGFI
ncbi:unnamed protein product [Sphagnum balticum]